MIRPQEAALFPTAWITGQRDPLIRMVSKIGLMPESFLAKGRRPKPGVGGLGIAMDAISRDVEIARREGISASNNPASQLGTARTTSNESHC